MAQYQHLPLYKTTYDLLMRLMHITKSFEREYKYTIGEKIQNHILEILLDIYRANGSKNKTEHLTNLLEHVQMLNVLLRVSHDLKLIATEKYAEIILETASISKQATGWMKVE